MVCQTGKCILHLETMINLHSNWMFQLQGKESRLGIKKITSSFCTSGYLATFSRQYYEVHFISWLLIVPTIWQSESGQTMHQYCNNIILEYQILFTTKVCFMSLLSADHIIDITRVVDHSILYYENLYKILESLTTRLALTSSFDKIHYNSVRSVCIFIDRYSCSLCLRNVVIIKTFQINTSIK